MTTDDRDRQLVRARPASLAVQRELATRTLAELAIIRTTGITASKRIVVAADGSGDFRTIREALSVASEGDEIVVMPGRYAESAVIDKSVTVRGEGPRDLIQLTPSDRDEPCIAVSGGSPRILHLTIAGTEATRGAQAVASIVPTIRHREISPTLPKPLIHVVSGSPAMEDLEVAIGGGRVDGVVFNRGSGSVRRCQIHDGEDSRIVVTGDGVVLVEDNDIWAHGWCGVRVDGRGSLIRANRIHDCGGEGISVSGDVTIEANEVWATVGSGIWAIPHGPDLVVRANRVHDVRGKGISVLGGTIEDNEVWLNAEYGIGIHFSQDPAVLRANRVHDNQGPGVLVHSSNAEVEGNEIWGNAGSGVHIASTECDATVLGNRIYDNAEHGVLVTDGACPTIEDNDVSGNCLAAIFVSGTTTSPSLWGNSIHDGQGDGIAVESGAKPTISDNTIARNAGIAIRVDASSGPTIGQNTVDQD